MHLTTQIFSDSKLVILTKFLKPALRTEHSVASSFARLLIVVLLLFSS